MRLPLGSAILCTLGVLLLAWSLLSSPDFVHEPVGPSEWHTAPDASGAASIAGLALHPGPGAAELAASLMPVTAPTVIRAVALDSEGSERAGASSPAADQSRDQP